MKYKVLFLLFGMCQIVNAAGDAGTLDNIFGTGGLAITNFFENDSSPRAVIMQPNGKIVAGGSGRDTGNTSFVLARYNRRGDLDESFGNGGKVITDIGALLGMGTESILISLVLQADGKLVAGGQFDNGPNNVFALARYNADGSLDTSFGSDGNGLVTTDFAAILGMGMNSGITTLVLQADGKIVAVGQFENGANDVFALARYNADGSLDTSFGSDGNGLVTTDVAAILGMGMNSGITTLVLQADGKIVAGGVLGGVSDGVFALARYNADGSLDTSFGSDGNGLVTTDVAAILGIGDLSLLTTLVLQADGKIVAGGFSGSFYDGLFALARYNADGSLDTSFGSDGNGLVTTDFAAILDMGMRSFIAALVLQADGKLIAAGQFENDANSVVALARYNADGSLDTSFGSDGNGLVTTDVAAILDMGMGSGINALVLQADGQIIALGLAELSDDDFAIARYQSGLVVSKVAQAAFAKYGLISDRNKQLQL